LRSLRLTDIPRDIAATTAVVDGHVHLALTWSDGHHALFAPDWLRARCYSSAEREYRRFKPVLWGPELSDTIPRCDYDNVRADETEHLRLLEHLRDYGFVHLCGAPVGPEASQDITDLVGTLRVTNYGSSYDFIAKPTPLVQGDTGTKLEPHTDEPYRYWPPAITFFQVFSASEDGGGASILVDAFRVAEVLRQRDPDAFRMLSHAP